MVREGPRIIEVAGVSVVQKIPLWQIDHNVRRLSVTNPND
jgi:hypothetical protein